MFQKNEENIKYLQKWEKKYGTTGKFKTDEWQTVVNNLEVSLATKTGKNK